MLRYCLLVFALLLAGCVDSGPDPVPEGKVAVQPAQTAPKSAQAVAASAVKQPAKSDAAPAAKPLPDAKAATGPRILVIGDSMFAVNRIAGASVANVIEKELGVDVTDRATIGARYFLGLPLRPQYSDEGWDWVVINGGGNDLLFGCGCGTCTRMLDRLVSKDGRGGTIPAFVAKIRKSGAKVVYSGYLRNPGVQTPIKSCGPAGNELDRRLTLMAGFDAGVIFLPMSDLVPYGDRSYHGFDLIHPSVKGSRGIGKRIAAVIAKGR